MNTLRWWLVLVTGAMTGCGGASKTTEPAPAAATAPADNTPAAETPKNDPGAAAPTDDSADELVDDSAGHEMDERWAPVDVGAPPRNAERTTSGLSSRVLRAGTGTEHPRATSKVEVHYRGWTADGREFDSSYRRGQTATFPLDRVIEGWT